MTIRHSLLFQAPYQVTIQPEPIPKPAADQVLIQTKVSAISPGSEMLVYRGQLPASLSLDATITSLAESASQYPIRYGYACVGSVIETGSAVDPNWLGRMVFAFHPHTTHFVARIDDLLPSPAGLSAETAALYPNMETAVTFALDGTPAIGERVVVVGAGVVGLLTTALLARFPLASLSVIDPLPHRRQLALALGAHHALAPDEFRNSSNRQFLADLTYELSGNPAALDTAIQATGFGGRVVIGSWYGQKRAPIDLGGHFHRSRIHLISSQVSTLAPERTGRWDRARRTEIAWAKLGEIDTQQLITHRYSLHEAASAYAQIDQRAAETVQVLLEY